MLLFWFGFDCLIILSDINGYYDKNPNEFSNACIKKAVGFIADEELNLRQKPVNKFASSGIVTKLYAAKFLMQENLKMFLGGGFDLSDAYAFVQNSPRNEGKLFCKSLNNTKMT